MYNLVDGSEAFADCLYWFFIAGFFSFALGVLFLASQTTAYLFLFNNRFFVPLSGTQNDREGK